ncbi:MAG: hypothetical protein RSE61_05420 [Anaerovoracaceae bacterium]
MYPVSVDFLKAINSNSRRCFWSGIITTKQGQIYKFENEDILKGSGYIIAQCSGSSEIEIGSVYAAELGITIFLDADRYSLKDAEIKIYFHLELEDNTRETIPMGIFEINEANRSAKGIDIKAYDYMLRLDKKLNLQSSSGTAFEFLTYASLECEVELAQGQEEIESLPNGKELLGIYQNNDIENYRDLLYYLAQILGCFCKINRLGKLELVRYGNKATCQIESKQRYDSNYSDFITRYTSVSSVNVITEETEYYSLEVDDGLTLNLGTNPLLQFGIKSTRERFLRNILNAILLIKYVPYDATTIGNPAIDVGDVISFSGGHADLNNLSCVTNITYKINGKHTLKGVGKNPRLAQAKSKNDKNIVGLINQVENGKTIVYKFINMTPFEIGNTFTEVLKITFTSKEETTAQFLGTFLLDILAFEKVKTIEGIARYDEESINQQGEAVSLSVSKKVTYEFMEKTSPEITVVYKINDDEVENFRPSKTCSDGKECLTLFLPISNVLANTKNTLSVSLKIDGGSMKIGAQQIQATVSGQGLVAGVVEWDGNIEIKESIKGFTLDDINLKIEHFNDQVESSSKILEGHTISETISLIGIGNTSFG